MTGVSSPSFFRSYDGLTYTDKSNPALVSDFRLDNYEVTVSRFRRFVAAYSQNMTALHAGANPNNPSDTGWDTTWNASLDADATALKAHLVTCPYPTWTTNAGTDAAENRPISCLTWFEAEAFCIWDGGRLPTEAEWNYAAVGGTAQRPYPWGTTAPDCSYANFYGFAGGTFCAGSAFGAVGALSPKGDGLYGQADLAGNAWEWVKDWYADAYPNPCSNCENTTASTGRVIRGGGFDSGSQNMLSSTRYHVTGAQPFSDGVGARCARAK